MLAHELAHYKRRDLAWNWLLLLGQTLFWFHPLVWLGAREWRMAQEVACDELAVKATQVPVAAYGAMLLQSAVKERSSTCDNLFAVGVGERYATLHKRLSAMKHFSSNTNHKRALLFCALSGVLALLPWHLATRTASAQMPSGKRASTDSEEAEVLARIRRQQGQMAVVEARIQDAVGRPISGATVIINPDLVAITDDNLLTATSDAKGVVRFRVVLPPSGDRFDPWATISAPGYGITQCNLTEGTPTIVRLNRAASVRGLVTDGRGRPVSGVGVQLRNVQGRRTKGGRPYLFLLDSMSQFTTHTNAKGIWTMSGLPQNARASFEIADTRFYAQGFHVTSGSDETMAPTQKVQPGATLAGRVRLPNGRPASGVEITGGGVVSSSRSILTGADGSYQITGLESGAVRILVRDPKNAWVAPAIWGVQVQRGKVTRVRDIVLSRGALLQGRVVDAASGRPVPGAQLSADFQENPASSWGGGFAFAIADQQGRYTLRVLPGKGLVSATNYGAKGARHSPTPGLHYTALPGQRGTLTIRMTPTFEVKGRAHDEAGRSVHTAVLVMRPLGEKYLNNHQRFYAYTDTGKTFRFTGLPRLKMQLTSEGNWEVVSPRQVTLPLQGKLDVTLRPLAHSSLIGRIRTPEGKPIVGAGLLATFGYSKEHLFGMQGAEMRTNTAGQFVLGHLRPRSQVFLVNPHKQGYVYVSGGRVEWRNNRFEVSDIILKNTTSVSHTSAQVAQVPPSNDTQYSSPTTPQGTLRTFAAALTRADLSQATTLIRGDKPSRDLSDVARAMRKVPTRYSINHLRLAQNAESATISFFFAADPLPSKATYESWAVLHKDGGTWRIDPVATLQLSNTVNPFPAFVSLLSGKRPPNDDDLSAVGSKLLRIGMVMQSFVTNNDGRFALKNGDLRDALLPYYPALDALLPSLPRNQVSFNTKLSGVTLNKVRFPARTVMLYEGQNGKLDFRHQGRAIVTLVQGNVRFVTPQQAKELLVWTP